jgi:uncharacterized protein
MNSTKIHITPDLMQNTESREFEGQTMLEPLELGFDTYTFSEPMSFKVRITNTGGALLVQGDVEGVGHTACARCLEDAAIEVGGELDGYYLIPGEEGAPEDLEGDEFEVLGEDKIIDLLPLIEAAILIDLPQIPLCKEDCLGICAGCGADLNTEECTCDKSVATGEGADVPSANNPFAVLKDYKFGD